MEMGIAVKRQHKSLVVMVQLSILIVVVEVI